MTGIDFNGNFAAKAEDCYIRVIAGLIKGKIISVPNGDFTLGRAAEADVHIKDKLISRKHCRLTFESGKWYIEDLGSTNGTWIIGQKVDRKVLLPYRTSARIGKTIFEIVVPGSTINTSPLDAARILQQIPLEEFNALHGPGESSEIVPAALGNRMAAIFAFQNMISFILEPQELYNKIVDAVHQIIPATSVYLLVFDLEKGEFITAAGWQDESVSVENDEIDKNIVAYTKENYHSVLVSGSPKAASRMIMCVPLLTREQSNGMLYLSRENSDQAYTLDDLWLLTVIGHSAGMAIQHRHMLEFNFRNERLVATGTTAAEISHYIKNILAAMDGSFNLLQMGFANHDWDLSSEAFGIFTRNHQRLSNTVLNLLNLSSEQKLNFQITDISKTIREVVDLMSPTLKDDGIKLDVNDDTVNLPLYVEADAVGIHRVLLNLLNNAEHAVMQKKNRIEQQDVGCIKLRAGFTPQKDQVCVTVEDDGIGLTPEQSQKLFSLFITNKGSAGTGLGLAVSKRIIEAHGGRIQAEGSPGTGCKISFFIPVARSDISTQTCTINL